uniref:Uncharacterized protein n=1 Tax=Cuerna arida TaxID=1464854 RepID=A0A1B6FT26_9HEMI
MATAVDNRHMKQGPYTQSDYKTTLEGFKGLILTPPDFLTNKFRDYQENCKNLQHIVFEGCQDLNMDDLNALFDKNVSLKQIQFVQCQKFKKFAFESFRKICDVLENLDLTGYPLSNEEIKCLCRVGLTRIHQLRYNLTEETSCMLQMKEMYPNCHFVNISQNVNVFPPIILSGRTDRFHIRNLLGESESSKGKGLGPWEVDEWRDAKKKGDFSSQVTKSSTATYHQVDPLTLAQVEHQNLPSTSGHTSKKGSSGKQVVLGEKRHASGPHHDAEELYGSKSYRSGDQGAIDYHKKQAPLKPIPVKPIPMQPVKPIQMRPVPDYSDPQPGTSGTFDLSRIRYDAPKKHIPVMPSPYGYDTDDIEEIDLTNLHYDSDSDIDVED